LQQDSAFLSKKYERSGKMNVTVVITLFNDMKVKRTIDSLRTQSHIPDQIIIADGGSSKSFQKEIKNYIKNMKNIQFKILPGRCIDTRRQIIDLLIEDTDTDIIAFIDSDEIATETWLKKLIEPIEKGKADFTGGPLIPTTAKSHPEHILNIICNENNKFAEKDISYMAMGNSAWHIDVFKKIGSFDDSSISNKTDRDTISGSYHISDDFDINIRARKAGLKGYYINDAVVEHNQSRINTYGKLLKYFYGQYVRTAMAYFKHKETATKFTKATRKRKIAHPFEFILFMVKLAALMNGWKEWNKINML